MRPVRPAPTVRDVAALAGVSISTVSRVINDQGLTRQETAERVRDAIEQLRFRPHGVGRSLKTARTLTLGVMVPSIENPVFAEALTGMEQSARDAGYMLLIASSAYEGAEEKRAVDALRSRGIDGMLLTVADPGNSAVLDALERDAIPHVLIYNQPARPDRPSVTVDNARAGREIVSELVARGHRRLGMVAGSFTASDRSLARYEGFLAGTRSAGLPAPALVEVGFCDIRLDRHLARLFATDDPPTALFCSNDFIAIAVIGGLRALGLSVPRDLSVVGFDGIAVGSLLEPSLATVVQPSRDMGRAAMAALLGWLRSGSRPGHAILPHHFRPGASLGPAPDAA